MEAKTRVLPDCNLLSDFDEEARQILTDYGVFKLLSAEEIVIRESQQQDALYILVSGLLHAVHQVSDGATPIGVIHEGECFGEINILDPAEASATVVARKSSVVWCMSRENLERYLNEHPVWGCVLLLRVGEILSRRTRGLVAKVNAVWEMSWR